MARPERPRPTLSWVAAFLVGVLAFGAHGTQAAHRNPTVMATIPVVTNQGAIGVGGAVDQVRNRLYVSNGVDLVSVIDGATNRVVASVRIPASGTSVDVAVNPNTNLVYATVSEIGGARLVVIDGATLAVLGSLELGLGQVGNLTVNPATNRVYVYGLSPSLVSPDNLAGTGLFVVDAPTRDLAAHRVLDPIAVPHCQWAYSAVEVDPRTNRIYLAEPGCIFFFEQSVRVIDANTNRVLPPIPLDQNWPSSIAVACSAWPAVPCRSQTNRVFVSSGLVTPLVRPARVSVLDGARDPPQVVGTFEGVNDELAFNPNTNRLYATYFDDNGSGLAVINVQDGTVRRGPAGFCCATLEVNAETDRLYRLIDGGVQVLADGPSTVADLELAKADSPDPVKVGQTLTYRVTVTNHGPDEATAVTLTDTLPDGVRFDSASPSQGTCRSGLTCDLGSLAPGASALVTITVKPAAPGTLTNTATVDADQDDPDLDNNTAEEPTTVEPAVADLALAKGDSPDPVGVGRTLTYTLTVTNHGPDEATAVTLTDTLPSGVRFESAMPSQGTCPSGTSCDLGSLALGATAVVAITVKPATVGTVTNIADVDADQDDPDLDNNTAQEVTTVEPCPREIGFGETIVCSIDAPGETDEFLLSTATDSTRVLVRVASEVGSPVEPEVRVVRSGAELCRRSRETPGLVEFRCTLGPAGLHAATVSDRGGDETGGYRLHLQRLSNPPAAPNCTPIDYGQTLTAAIDVPLETDCLSFTSTSDSTRVLLRLRASTIDPELHVFDASGARRCARVLETPGLLELRCTLGPAGPHTLLVYDHLGADTGDYRLHLQRLSNPPAAPNCTPIEYLAIADGETLPGSIDVPLETDCFSLATPTTSTRVLLRLSASQIDPELHVFDAVGTRLCARSRETPGLLEFRCTLRPAGPHTLLVYDHLGADTGDYELYVQTAGRLVGLALDENPIAAPLAIALAAMAGRTAFEQPPSSST